MAETPIRDRGIKLHDVLRKLTGFNELPPHLVYRLLAVLADEALVGGVSGLRHEVDHISGPAFLLTPTRVLWVEADKAYRDVDKAPDQGEHTVSVTVVTWRRSRLRALAVDGGADANWLPGSQVEGVAPDLSLVLTYEGRDPIHLPFPPKDVPSSAKHVKPELLQLLVADLG